MPRHKLAIASNTSNTILCMYTRVIMSLMYSQHIVVIHLPM